MYVYYIYIYMHTYMHIYTYKWHPSRQGTRAKQHLGCARVRSIKAPRDYLSPYKLRTTGMAHTI